MFNFELGEFEVDVPAVTWRSIKQESNVYLKGAAGEIHVKIAIPLRL